MYNFNDIDLDNKNFKQRRRLFNNLKLIIGKKDTSNLISIKHIKKGNFLAIEGEPVNGIYFILEGKAKVFNAGLNQKNQILRLVSKGDIVGLSSLNSTRYWSSVMVIESVKAYFINLKNLKFILKSNNKLSILLVNSLALKLRHYEVRQKHLSLLPASERVIDALLLTAYKFGVTSDQGIEISSGTSRKDLASFANTSAEKAIRTLSYLKSIRHIEICGKKIVIKNKDGLINLLSKQLENVEESTDLKVFYPNLFY